jgi:8-oxo-(d)GTP phosphatase
VQAAGCVVWRRSDTGPRLLLVHRPRYDDWSFPKGKLDSGETPVRTAIREVHEETGLRVRLGPRLPDQRYTISGGQSKLVTYWAARPLKASSIKGFKANDEVDVLRWLPVSKARARLSYARDRLLLDAFVDSGFDSEPLVVVRHAEARKRSGWSGRDVQRPLKAAGKKQAARLVPLLASYGISHVVSSDATRCVQTVSPYVKASGATLSKEPVLSEQGYDERRFAERVRELLEAERPTALCTHRPQLLPLFDVAGVDPIGLMPAELVVLHRQAGKVVDCEQHAV